MMSRHVSQKMLNEQIVTKQQLSEAASRQRLHGGRLGQNLVALGYISEDQLGTFFKRTPPAPETVEETGLSLQFIADLALKHVMSMGEFRLSDLSRSMGLSTAILDEVIGLLRREKDGRSARCKSVCQILFQLFSHRHWQKAWRRVDGDLPLRWTSTGYSRRLQGDG